jgi:hypothetical protein
MKMTKVLWGVAVTAIVISVAWAVFMFAPSPSYRTAAGATVTQKVRLLPPSEWGVYQMQACGPKGGTHCTAFGFVERCVSTFYP